MNPNSFVHTWNINYNAYFFNRKYLWLKNKLVNCEKNVDYNQKKKNNFYSLLLVVCLCSLVSTIRSRAVYCVKICVKEHMVRIHNIITI